MVQSQVGYGLVRSIKGSQLFTLSTNPAITFTGAKRADLEVCDLCSRSTELTELTWSLGFLCRRIYFFCYLLLLFVRPNSKSYTCSRLNKSEKLLKTSLRTAAPRTRMIRHQPSYITFTQIFTVDLFHLKCVCVLFTIVCYCAYLHRIPILNHMQLTIISNKNTCSGFQRYSVQIYKDQTISFIL